VDGCLVHALEPVAVGRAGLGRRRAEPARLDGFGQKFVDEITGDWAGKVMTDLDAVFNAVSAMPFVDEAAWAWPARATAATP
jgi:hypothetical protein